MYTTKERRQALKEKESSRLANEKAEIKRIKNDFFRSVDIKEEVETDYPSYDFQNIKKEFEKLAKALGRKDLSSVAKKIIVQNK